MHSKFKRTLSTTRLIAEFEHGDCQMRMKRLTKEPLAFTTFLLSILAAQPNYLWCFVVAVILVGAITLLLMIFFVSHNAVVVLLCFVIF